MELSSAQKIRNQHQFEAFCKKVLNGERCDYFRELRRRSDKEVCFSDLPEALLNSIGAEDEYSVEWYDFEVYGHRMRIHSDRLADALTEIGSEAYSILLLSYCLDLSDREIANLLGRSRSNIQRRRSQLLDVVKKRMEG